MSDLTSLIDAHLSSYADADAGRRAAVVERIWATDGQLIDPPMAATGHAQIGRQAEQLLAQFPGHHFVRSSGIDSHHDMARYAWQLVGPAGAVVLEGTDIVRIDAQGRLAQVTGFFGTLPAMAPPSEAAS
ncbi:MAG: nuclear transport factor 2 family protein [Pseudomonadota bacterium]|nr:nuclear transport factor 2 family protein [Pseudomonadota bacterium]